MRWWPNHNRIFLQNRKIMWTFSNWQERRNFLSIFHVIYFNRDSNHQRLCDVTHGNLIVLITFAHQVFTETDKWMMVSGIFTFSFPICKQVLDHSQFISSFLSIIWVILQTSLSMLYGMIQENGWQRVPDILFDIQSKESSIFGNKCQSPRDFFASNFSDALILMRINQSNDSLVIAMWLEGNHFKS